MGIRTRMKNETKLFIRDAHWALQQTALLLLAFGGVFIAGYNVLILGDALNPSLPGQPSTEYLGTLLGNGFWAIMIGTGCVVWYYMRKRAYQEARKREDNNGEEV